MKIVSVILARGGSKGIPKKNIVDVGGFPLISYCILASIKSKVSETWVSTDDEEIAEESKMCGAQVLWRPKELATDTASSEDELLHFAENVSFDILVFIQPTSPLLQYKDINSGLELLNEYDSVFSAYKEHWYPRWTKENILGAEISMAEDWNINERPRRQDVKEKYVENGAFYITTKKDLLESGLRYSKNIGIFEMPFYRSLQVDTPEDLMVITDLLHFETIKNRSLY